MFTFSGTAFGKPFNKLTAKSGEDLVQKIIPWSRNKLHEYKMYVKCINQGGFFYFNICLGSNQVILLETAVAHMEAGKEGAIETVIVYANQPSPNTSPTGKSAHSKANPVITHEDSVAKDLVKQLDDIKLSRSESTEDLTLYRSESFDTLTATALNTKCPFTQEKVEDLNPNSVISLVCPKTVKGNIVAFETFLVDFEGLKTFVTKKSTDNNNLIDLCIPHVACFGGKTRNVQLSPYVWIDSILGRSTEFRAIFSESIYVDSTRKLQLQKLKTAVPFLYEKVLMWYADMFNLNESEDRLISFVSGYNVPPCMSSYYFFEHEARYLGKILVRGSKKSFKELMHEFVVEHGSSVVCTAHPFAPMIKKVFNIDKAKVESESFVQFHKAYVKSQQETFEEDPPTLLP
jgi:hypothetical protein